MFYLRKFRLLSTLSSIFFCFFLTPLSATATSGVAKTEKLKQQEAVILASSDIELRSQQQANVRLEQIEPQTDSVNYYNKIVRVIQNLPSNGQSRDILAKDNNIQRLLKQQLNDSLEVYQIIGQLLEEEKIDFSDYDNVLSFIGDFNLPFYQGVLIAIAQTDLVTDTEEKLIANNACLEIAREGEQIAQLRVQAGVSSSVDALIVRYLRRHCEIQRIELELGKSDIESNAIRENIRESQFQPQRFVNLAGLERSFTEEVERSNPNNPFINNYPEYIANTKLLQKLNLQGGLLEIQTDDSDLQKLYKLQLKDADELYRSMAILLQAGVAMDDNDIDAIMLSAILIAKTEINLATQPNEREIASNICSEITQKWKDVLDLRKTTLETRIRVLTVNYWKRQCDIQKLQTDKI